MKIKANDLEAEAHLALPASGKGPGVLVLHPWWGLNEDIKNVADRLAAAGFVALAPDLYDGRIATTIEQAEAYSGLMDSDAAETIIKEATQRLLAHEACQGPKIGVIGFSLGAMYAVGAAYAQPEQITAVVLFYGAGMLEQTDSQASYLGHFAANDPYEDADYIAQMEQSLKENGRPTTFHSYPNTGHWFFEPSRPDAYDAEAANLAWQRTVRFLQETLS
ncbi:MAG: dienelactone hydrolase family protein [Anaerolineales bacterium]|nr:dienelactone hydrolase family protein [Anaerolineales bacterium]MCB8937034.1 dienelactone hydrolase family protein [Ardenticatenaceae bacterium]